MAEKEIIKLSVPIQFGSEEIKVLEVKRPKARHFRDMKENPTFGDILDLLADLSDQPSSVLDELDPADFDKIEEVFGRFFPNSRKTGSKRPGR